MKKIRKFTILVHLIAWFISLIWIIPFLGVFMSSIRPQTEILNGWWNFGTFHTSLEGYVNALTNPSAPLSRALVNSLIVTIPATFLPIFVSALGAYAFARFSFPTRDILFLAIMLLQTIPQQMVIIPLFFVALNTGLYNTFIGLVLVHTAFALPWQILFLRNFFSVLPVEIEEAARIDGAGYLKIFYRIVLPLSLPALASLVALQFVWVWNDFFFAIIMIARAPETGLATTVIPAQVGRLEIDWPMLSASSILVMIFPIAVYAALQRYYVRGIVAGAVKG
jgi:multiple sugar transport system permease protein